MKPIYRNETTTAKQRQPNAKNHLTSFHDRIRAEGCKMSRVRGKCSRQEVDRRFRVFRRPVNHVHSSIQPCVIRRTCAATSLPKARPVQRGVQRRLVHARPYGTHWPSGGCQSSTLLPSGSMTQPNLPYSESSVFSRTSQPSLRNAVRRLCRSATR